MLSLFRQQPPAFRMIFMLEIWERFGYYTTQGILTLYLIRSLNMTSQESYYTFGAFSALVYGMVSLGGFLGDKVLGTKRTIVLGLIVLGSGYGALIFVPNISIYFALGLIAVGSGLFKANPSNLLSLCYEPKDSRLTSAFTLYYMAVNIGAIAALVIGPYLADRFGYPYAYFASYIGIILGLLNYRYQNKYIKHIRTLSDDRHIPIWGWFMTFIGIGIATYLSAYLLQHMLLTKRVLFFIILICISIYLFFMQKENKIGRQRMIVALILMVEAVVFFTLYQQMPTSLTLFAVHHIRHSFWHFSIDPQSFQALNPIWIIFISPILVKFYSMLPAKHPLSFTPYKFALGMLCCSVSFGVLYFSRFMADNQAMISPCWVVLSYCFQSLAELLVSALGVAMIAELVSEKIRGFAMGMWFLTSSIAGFSGAYIASLTGLKNEQTATSTASLETFTSVFGWISISCFCIALILWFLAPYLTRMMSTKPGAV